MAGGVYCRHEMHATGNATYIGRDSDLNRKKAVISRVRAMDLLTLRLWGSDSSDCVLSPSRWMPNNVSRRDVYNDERRNVGTIYYSIYSDTLRLGLLEMHVLNPSRAGSTYYDIGIIDKQA